ncbi:MAG: PKD domain-containing protein [Salibacteraceae bacterium]
MRKSARCYKSYPQKVGVLLGLLVLLLLISLPHSVHATHAQGMDLTYQCLGGDSFAFELHFYRDCDGVNAPGVGGSGLPSVDFNSASCGQSFSRTFQLVSSQEIGVICSSLTTTCNNGIYPGVEEYVYRDTLVIPAACTDWVFSYDLCCRNNAINTINPTNVDIYVETTLNNVVAPCNSSPEFAANPVPFLCIGSPYCFNNGAIDPDGDSLVYSLVTPTTGPNAGDTVNYTGSFSATQPLSSSTAITFDSTTGEICLTPTTFEVSVMQIRVEEWRNGVLVGSLDRDIQLRVTNCVVPNMLPEVNGINGTGVFNASVCAGDSFCFTTDAVDTNSGQTVLMTWNNGIPDASFMVSADSVPTGSFCWLPDSSDISPIPYCFTVTVEDDNCPFIGTQTFTFCITVTGFIDASVTGVDPACHGDCNGTTNAVVTNGTTPYTYQWNTGQTTAGLNALCPGTYTVTVTDSVGCNPVRSITLAEPPLLGAQIGTPTGIPCFGDSLGSATVIATGGTGAYTFDWDVGTGNQTVASAVNLLAGTYTVTVSDFRGCDSALSITISEPPLLTAVAAQRQAVICRGDSTGSAYVQASGGVAPYTYQWDANAANQTTDTAFNLAAGSYFVTVTDNNGCDSVVSVAVSEPSTLNGNLVTITNVACFGDSSGQLSFLASGGTPPYAYQWSPNVTGVTVPSASNLSAGAYSLTITDSAGCDTIVNATVQQNPKLTVDTTLLQNVSCFDGIDGAISVLGGGGQPNYTYSWSTGGSTSGISGLSAGNYTVTVTDNLNCDTSLTIALNQPGLLGLLQDSLRNISCNGGTDGAIRVAASGGTPPYAYQWSNGAGNATTPLVTGLAAGNYAVTVTDSLGCDSVLLFSLTEPSTLQTATSVAQGISCFGFNDGQVWVQATGGTLPYTYNWVTTANDTAFNLATGTYRVTVTDSLGCFAIDSIFLSQPALLTINEQANQRVTCFGESNGASTVVAGGGTTPYTYLWDAATGNQNTALANNLIAGNYQVTLTDTNGCDTALTIIISEPDLLMPQVDSLRNVSCFGGNDGLATVLSSGGTAPYTYQWDAATGNQTGPPAMSLSTGNYSVTVTDSVGCDSVLTLTITEPALLFSNLGPVNDALCFGDANGSVSVVPGGGTAPYNYLWDNNANNQSDSLADSLAAGTYTVTITDQQGCTLVDTATIHQPAVLQATVMQVDSVSCFGLADAAALASGAGGTVPYTFLWDTAANLQSTAIANNLAAGSYRVMVTDSNGCEALDSINIAQPTPLVLNLINTINVSCFGGADGSATVNASGGTAPYNYLWDAAAANQTAAFATTLSAGNYQVTLTDTNSCDTSITVTISEPGLLIPQVDSLRNVSCFGGNDGQVTVLGTGGTTPYTYQWDAATGNQTGPMAINLAAGTYAVTVTDSLGCDSIISITVAEPNALTASIGTLTHVFCFGGSSGSASVLAGGGTAPYAYQWDTAAGLQTAALAGGLTVGNYAVTVTDSLGCQADTLAVILEPPPLVVSVGNVVNVDCAFGANGAATAVASGGTPGYSFTWDANTGGQTTAMAVGLLAGTYQVTLTDSNGCDALDSVTINAPAPLTATITNPVNVSCFGGNDGQASVIPGGGVQPYTFSWGLNSGNQTGTFATGLVAGTYILTLVDSNGCSTSDSVVLTEPSLLSAPVTVLNNVSCFGGSNGNAAVNPVGGTLPYTYLWSTGTGSQTTDTAVGLAFGSYLVTVTDSLGCDTVQQVVISEPPLLTVQVTNFNDISCFGGNDGSITALAQGGTPAYSYQWGSGTGNQTGTLANNLPIGNYNLTVTDSLGCTNTLNQQLSQPAPFQATITGFSNVSCFGGTDGWAVVQGLGGTLPYSISWGINSGNQSSDTATNLGVGTYVAVLTDSLGCNASDTIALTAPNPLSSLLGSLPVTCFGGSDGQVAASVSGGTLPYTYQWSGAAASSPTAIVNGLPEGTYTLVVTDSQGCQITDSLSILQASPIDLSVEPDAIICVGTNYQITAGATGGNGGYTFTWDQGLGAGNTHTVSPNQTTLYTVTVVASTGCSGGQDTVEIQVKNLANDNLSLAVTGPICLGETATLSAIHNGAIGPYTYTWQGFPTVGIGPVDVGPSVSTYYYFTVEDDCGQALNDSIQVIVDAMVVQLPDTIAQGCPPLVVDFEDSTNVGSMTYLWTFGDGSSSTNRAPSHEFTLSGIYTVNVTAISASGCSASTASTNFVKVNTPPIADFLPDPAEVSVQDPTVIFYDQSLGAVSQRSWDFGDGGTDVKANPVYVFSEVGTYPVTYRVEDRFGCATEVVKPITVTPFYTLDIPNAFTTNPSGPGSGAYDPTDLSNDVFFPFTQYVEEYHLLVFNRWGEIVFESFDIAIGWDGYYRGELCQQDVYAYKVTFKWLDGVEKTVVGDVTLIR